jgi:hypothetical protein
MSRNLDCPVDETMLAHDSLHEIAFGAARNKILDVVRKSVIDPIQTTRLPVLSTVETRISYNLFELVQRQSECQTALLRFAAILHKDLVGLAFRAIGPFTFVFAPRHSYAAYQLFLTIICSLAGVLSSIPGGVELPDTGDRGAYFLSL